MKTQSNQKYIHRVAVTLFLFSCATNSWEKHELFEISILLSILIFSKFEKLPDELLKMYFRSALLFWLHFLWIITIKSILNLLFEYYIDFMIYLDLTMCVYVYLSMFIYHPVSHNEKPNNSKTKGIGCPHNNIRQYHQIYRTTKFKTWIWEEYILL